MHRRPHVPWPLGNSACQLPTVKLGCRKQAFAAQALRAYSAQVPLPSPELCILQTTTGLDLAAVSYKVSHEAMANVSPEERPGGTTGLTEDEPRVVLGQGMPDASEDINPKIKEQVMGAGDSEPTEQAADATRPQEVAEHASASKAAGVVIDPDTGGKMEVGLPETDKPIDVVAVDPTSRG